jgi:hypothetical protein
VISTALRETEDASSNHCASDSSCHLGSDTSSLQPIGSPIQAVSAVGALREALEADRFEYPRKSAHSLARARSRPSSTSQSLKRT